MFVQVGFSELLAEGTDYVGYAQCKVCHGTVGPVSMDELQALLSGKYGDVLCYDCEETPPRKTKKLEFERVAMLKRLYNTGDMDEVPVSAWSWWGDPGETVALQNAVVVGWCFWVREPDGRDWRLRRVNLPHSDAAKIRRDFYLEPLSVG